MSKHYLIRLSPLGRYFFGGERTFGFDNDNANYLVRSRYLPQQTTLLGMVRQQLLYANQLLNASQLKAKVTNQSKAIDIIGDTGFKVGQNPNSYGIINQLSALQLYKDGQAYYPAPLDYQKMWEKDTNGDAYHFQGEKGQAFLANLKEYNTKDASPLCRAWINQTGDLLKSNAIFQEKGQVGIIKRTAKTKDEGGFYKQFYVQMSTGIDFAFYLSLAAVTGVKHLPEQSVVHMGKEQSPFLMQTKEVSSIPTPPTLNSSPSMVAQTQKIVLLSDTLLKETTLAAYSDFGVTEIVPFRYLSTSISQTKHFYNLVGDKKANNKVYQSERVSRSVKFNLLKRGSVIYSTKASALTTAIDQDHPEFKKIGYNQYIIV